MLTEGDQVPDFALKDAEGKTVKKSDLKGKKYVVYFYPKDFTPGCTTEAAEFAQDYKKFKTSGIEIMLLSLHAEEHPGRMSNGKVSLQSYVLVL